MIDWRGIDLWNKNFGIDVVENMIVYTVFYLITVVIVDYAVRDLAASPSEAGLAAGIFIIAGLVGRMLAGKWIASVGMKKMLYIGLVIFLVATLLYFGVENLFMLYIVRFLHGLINIDGNDCSEDNSERKVRNGDRLLCSQCYRCDGTRSFFRHISLSKWKFRFDFNFVQYIAVF